MSKKDMLGTARRKLTAMTPARLVSICDLLERLSDDEWFVAFKKFLRHENPWSRSWREENGVIRDLSVTSDGTTGPEWILRLEAAGHEVSNHAKEVLLSSDFNPTIGVTYEIEVLKRESSSKTTSAPL